MNWTIYKETEGSLRFQKGKEKFNVSVTKILKALRKEYPDLAEKIRKAEN